MTEHAYPHSPSNRNLIDQMQLWGWEVKRQRADVWQMALGKEKVHVAAPTHHSRTKDYDIKRIIGCTTAGNYQAFWARKVAAIDQPAVELSSERNDTTVRYDRPRLVGGQAVVGGRDPLPVADADEPEPPESPAPNRKIRHRGLSAKVVDVLVASGDPLSTGAIANRLNLDAPTVSNACNYLYSQGTVRRVMHGVYQIVHHHDVRVTHTTSSSEHREVTESETKPAVWQRVDVPPRGADANKEFAVVDGARPELTDDDFAAVLDILLPNGFKAKHLGIVNDWMDRTRQLVKEVTS